jgi:elongation factor Ts
VTIISVHSLLEVNDFFRDVGIVNQQRSKVGLLLAIDGVEYFSSNTIHCENCSTKHHSNGKIIALACETEPVSKVPDFNNLAKTIIDKAAASHAPSAHDLLAEPLADGRSLEGHIIDLTGKIGEKITLAAYENVTAEKVVSYIHSNNKIGVLVAFENVQGADVSEVGKDIAMQITAMKPVALDKDGVDSETIEREIEIGKDQARQEGKPEAMLEKIAVGKLEKFYKESTLLNQQFVKDSSITIRQLLEQTQKGLTISSFKRISLV